MKRNFRKDIRKFLIGQDVEIALLTNSGKMAPFEGDIKSCFGLDGLTGADKVVEIRTPPTECPIEMVNSIRNVFKHKIKIHPKVLTYNWQAGSFKNFGLGGHLHCNLTKDIIPSEYATKVIGNYLGALSLCIEEKKEAHSRRNTGQGYGWLTDFRPQKYGFEVRCLSSWASSPAIALAHICLFKTVLFELVNNKSFNPVERFCDDDWFEIRTDKIKKHFDAIFSEITQMQLYPQYKEYIDIFKFLISKERNWFSCDKNGKILDMKETWGLCSNELPVAPLKSEIILNLPKVKGNPIFENL